MTIALLLIGSLTICGFLAAAAYGVTSLHLFDRGPRVGARVTWRGLPVPVIKLAQWTSFTAAAPVRDFALTDGLLWAATDGGLVVWDLSRPDVPPARFTIEHGLAANRVTSLGVGPDGALWAGTVGGLGRYDGRDWQLFRSADGLPSDEVRDIAVDRTGYLWVATSAGLARFDGRDWRTYTASGVLPPLPDNDTRALAVDATNRLWVGTQRGLAVYDGRRWDALTAASGLPNEQIKGLAIGPAGEVWISSEGGLIRYDGAAWSTFQTRANADSVAGAGGAIASLAVAADGSVYAGLEGERGGLVQIAPVTGSAVPVSLGADGGRTDNVTALLIDSSGAAWIGAGDSVIRRVGERADRLELPADVPYGEVNDLLSASGGLWVAADAGVARFNGRWTLYDPAHGLDRPNTHALALAPDNSLWAAGATALDGFKQFSLAAEQWETITCTVDAPQGLDIVSAVSEPDGSLWFATRTGVSHFDGDIWRQFTERDGLPGGPLTSLVLDSQGKLIVGGAGGLARFTGDDWQRIADLPVEYLAAGSSGLWAMSEGRLAHLNADEAIEPSDLPVPSEIRGMAAGDDGVWLATADGVLHYDGKGWRRFSGGDGLPGVDVTAVAVDQDNVVWAALVGDGQQIEISRFDGRNWTPHPGRDIAAEVLTDNVVRDVLVAPGGDVWFATANGINRYSEGRWSAYGREEGLPGPDVRALAWAFDSLWAATDLGLARFTGSGWQSFGTTGHDRPGIGVSTLAADPDRRALWLALDGRQANSLQRFDGNGWQTVALPSVSARVRRLTAGPDGRLMVLAEEAASPAIGLFDGETWQWLRDQRLPAGLSGAAIAPDNRLWLVSADAGDGSGWSAAVYDLEGDGLGRLVSRLELTTETVASPGIPLDTITPLELRGTDKAYLALPGRVTALELTDAGELTAASVLDLPQRFSRYTYDIETDTNGRVWIATERGVASLELNADSGNEDWRQYYAAPVSPAWWGSVSTMTVRPDGAVLLGTSLGGIGVYTGRAFDGVLHPSQGPAAWQRSFLPVTAALTDSNGDLWVATDGGGAARFRAGRWQVYAPDSLLLSPVRTLAATNEALWIGTANGVAEVIHDDESQCHFGRILPVSAVHDALRDATGEVWFGTGQSGVLRLTQDEQPRTELGNVPVPYIAAAPNGELWFVNRRQPWLTRMRPATGDGDEEEWSRLAFDRIAMEPESITGLAVAPNLELWIATTNGLVRFDGRRWLRLTTADGLADNTVSHVAITSDGAVWAATAGGLSRLTP